MRGDALQEPFPPAEPEQVLYNPRESEVDEPNSVEAEIQPAQKAQPSKLENVIRFNTRGAEKPKHDPVDIDHRGIPGF